MTCGTQQAVLVRVDAPSTVPIRGPHGVGTWWASLALGRLSVRVLVVGPARRLHAATVACVTGYTELAARAAALSGRVCAPFGVRTALTLGAIGCTHFTVKIVGATGDHLLDSGALVPWFARLAQRAIGIDSVSTVTRQTFRHSNLGGVPIFANAFTGHHWTFAVAVVAFVTLLAAVRIEVMSGFAGARQASLFHDFSLFAFPA